MPDGRSLCDLKAPARSPRDASPDELRAVVEEELSASACGSCLVLAARIRRQACANLERAKGRVVPTSPIAAWEQLKTTRWAHQVDLDAFLARQDLDRIRYDAVADAVDQASVDQLVSEHTAHWKSVLAKLDDENTDGQAD